ncbi:3-oxoacyl-[acyl-carrier-protein] reductase FabG [Calycomorphotria hydatis]|uniref:3-oxoacyl-[acyl-carrier-protein] reductase FabG n=2 Tax=Calycomorphotria hydatis TaxID=2528027 RepID=A0A517T5Q5_9PLAN|nr:3-oxoacyl-[acyl-carrier-protein] reductase FabG [Calycomorphotria hydatis]
MELTGKTAIVTGGAVRLGRAIALRLADEGANVVLHYGRSEQDAEQTAEEIRKRGVNAITVQANLNEPVQAAEKIVSTAVAEFQQVDVLINSAAIFEHALLVDTEEDLYDRHMNINLKAPFFLSREFARALQPTQHGVIINMVDWRGLRVPSDFSAYNLTKAGLVALTQNLALQLAPQVRVNGIAPGAILPPPDANHKTWAEEKSPDVPLKTVGGPDDIADAVAYLVKSDFVNGEILTVTGGEHL